MNKVPLPLRNYKQMVRVVRDKNAGGANATHVPYKLGYAYTDSSPGPAITRERSLDELGLDSRTTRQPESAGQENFLSSRETTAHFHQLNTEERLYFTGTSPKQAPSRQDGWPGTKSRAWLGSSAKAQNVTIPPPGSEEKPGIRAASTKQNELANKAQQQHHANPQPVYPQPPVQGKQTKLPIVKASSLKGTTGSNISFDI